MEVELWISCMELKKSQVVGEGEEMFVFVTILLVEIQIDAPKEKRK